MMICKSDRHCELCSSDCEFYTEVEEVIEANWIVKRGVGAFCSNCNFKVSVSNGLSYTRNGIKMRPRYMHCPNCGATMIKGEVE